MLHEAALSRDAAALRSATSSLPLVACAIGTITVDQVTVLDLRNSTLVAPGEPRRSARARNARAFLWRFWHSRFRCNRAHLCQVPI